MISRVKPEIGLKRWGPGPEELILHLWEDEGVRKDKIDP